MSTPRSCRFPPTPRLSERKRALFPSPLSNLSPQSSILSEIGNTPRRSNRLFKLNLTPVRECNENVTPSSRGTAHTPLYLSGDSSDLGHMSPLESTSSSVRYDSCFNSSPEIDSPSSILARTRFFNKRNLKFDEPLEKNLEPNLDKNLERDISNIQIDPETPRKNFAGIFSRREINKEKENIENKSRCDTIFTSSFTNRSTKNLDIESLLDADSIIPETPVKIAPAQDMRTPHEHFPENIEPPKLHSRKSFSEINRTSPVFENNLILKRKQLDDSFDGPNKKVFKLEENPKARASLFPETNSLFSAKSFYPKSKEYNTLPANKNSTGVKNTKTIVTRKRSPVVSKRLPRRSRPDINLGVMHKIRKPRSKRSSLNTSLNTTTDLLGAAMDIIDNSPLNDYLKNLPKTRQSLPSLETFRNETKENKPIIESSPNISVCDIKPQKEFSISLNIAADDNENSNENSEPIPGRKFFKSKRRSLSNKIIKLQDNIVVNIKSKKSKPIVKMDDTITNDVVIKNEPELFKEADEEVALTPVQSEIEKLLSEWHETDESFIESTPSTVSVSQSVELIDLEMMETQQQLALIDSTIAAISESSANLDPMLTDSVLLSPTSQISSMTSFMALDSPISQSNSSPSEMFEAEMNSKKYYPLFYKDSATSAIPVEEPAKKHRQKKMWKPNGAQYQIDAGQKKFGATQCDTCGLMYQIADPEEELFHFNYHHSLHVLNFQGWRNESVISVLPNVGRIIRIIYNSPKSWHKRVSDLHQIIDNELGIVSSPYKSSVATQAYLMANGKQIIGLAIASTLAKANRLIPTNDCIELCTAEEFDVKCGVSRIWIAPPFRGRGYALSILNALRCNFMFGKILDLDEIAFSTPTPTGLSLAKKFFRRDDFLVYSGC